MTDQSHNMPADMPADKPAASAERDTPIGEIERLLKEQIDELEDLVREHPLAAVGIAAGAGLIAALLLSRR